MIAAAIGLSLLYASRIVFPGVSSYTGEFIDSHRNSRVAPPLPVTNEYVFWNGEGKTSVYKGYKQDKIEMRGDRAEMSDFPLYLNTVAGGLDRRDQTIGGFSFVVKIYAVPVVEIIG